MPSSDDAEIQSPIEEEQSPIEEEQSPHSSEHPMDSPQEEGDGSSEIPKDEADADDASQEIESEGHGKDPASVCSSLEKSEAIPAPDGHGVENAGGDDISVDHSNELRAAHPNDGDFHPSGSSKPIISASEDDGIPESVVDSEDGAMIQTEEKSSHEALENTQNDDTEMHGVIKTSLSVDTLIGEGSGDGEPDSVVHSEKEIKPPLVHMAVPSSVDSMLSSPSSQTPRRRLRSESLDTEEFEKITKRPSLVCEFFAKGWCIKGKSCRFLHQKDGVDNADQQARGDLSGARWKGEPQEITGVRREAVETSGSSKSRFLQFPEDHKFLSVQREDLSSDMLTRRDYQPFSLAREDPRLNSSVRDVYRENPRHDFLVDNLKSHSLGRQDISPLLMIRDDSKVYGRSFEVPSLHGKHPHDETFDRNSPLTRNNSISQYFSASSSLSSNMYGNYGNRFPLDRNVMDATILKQQTHFSLFDAHPSSSLNNSLNTTFGTSLQSTLISPPRSFGLPGSLSTHGSSPLSTDHLGVALKLPETEAGYSVSGSTPLKPLSSSPSFLRPEAENLPISRGYKTYSSSNPWEPSVPFRSSFVSPSAGVSSPGSQYDPLRDSIEPPNGGKGTDIQNMPPGQTNGDHAITGERDFHPFLQSHSSLLEKNFYDDGAYVPPVEAGHEKEDRRSVLKEEKGWNSGYPANVATASELDPLDGNLTHQTEGGRGIKDSKTLKYFRAALVDFVKELVKPSWRGGHLSKDAHKTIVKKAVDKVLGALQPHQIPSTSESVNQYLSSSRPKLAKLVEGYVDKYAKE